jgi:protocatechuate 3,4-dioxygenase beta subunit
VDVTDVYGALTGLTLTSGPFPGQNNSSQTDPYKLEISNQTDNLTADFGYIGSASIGDFVWEDTNGNGVQDASESGLAGVTVELHDNEGNLKGTDITDANGNYSFYVMPGVYYVRFMPPTGYSFSPQDKGDDDAKDSDAATTGQTIMTTLVFGENDLTWDAGLYRPATLGDYVWEDLDADGIQDDGEFGIANAKVELYDSAGNLVATTHTDGSGFYSFTGLMPGDYYLVFTAPTGYFFSPQDQGGDDTKDSDANASGQTTVTSLTSGENDTTWDAGLYQLASIGDFVWLDSDRDGVQEPEVGELGLAGVTVKLYTSTGTLVASTTTGVNGQYLFSNLMPGSYYLVFTAPSGYLFTLHDQGTNDAKDSDANPANGMTAVTSLTSGENDLTWDAGLYLRTSPGVGTPGYWKNHPEAWPVQSITIGGVTYTKELAISWMSRDNRRDKTITMFRSLVAAKLNVAIGNLSSCIEDTIRAADAWMAQYGPVGSGVRGNSDAWKAGEPLYLKLDDYNNGKLCAPARD